MDNSENEENKVGVTLETHIFTTLKYDNEADNGFSGNMALLIEAVQNSRKVKDEGIKLIAKGIFNSVVKHQVIKHSKEDIKKALKEIEEKKKQAEESSDKNE